VAVNYPPAAEEAALSIKTFYHVNPPELLDKVLIVVYTNLPDVFTREFPDRKNLYIEYLDDEAIREWLGPEKFIFRAKIKSFIHCVKKYKMPVLFIDDDTVFLKPAGPLFELIDNPGNIIMQYKENTLSYKAGIVHRTANEKYPDSLYEDAFLQHLLTRGEIQAGGKVYTTGADMPLWNSGVIGLHPDNYPLLEETLVLADYLYEAFHIRLAEQAAYSLVLNSGKPVLSVNDQILHYWFLKEARYLYDTFFDDKTPFKSPRENTKERIIDEIKGVTENRRIAFEDLLLFIPYLTKKWWGKSIHFLEMNVTTGGFLQELLFDGAYYQNAVETIRAKYTIELTL
jgi:hypothetical protein